MPYFNYAYQSLLIISTVCEASTSVVPREQAEISLMLGRPGVRWQPGDGTGRTLQDGPSRAVVGQATSLQPPAARHWSRWVSRTHGARGGLEGEQMRPATRTRTWLRGAHGFLSGRTQPCLQEPGAAWGHSGQNLWSASPQELPTHTEATKEGGGAFRS